MYSCELFCDKAKRKKEVNNKANKTYFASEFERGTCVEKFLRVQAVILTFGNMHIRFCPVLEFQTCEIVSSYPRTAKKLA